MLNKCDREKTLVYLENSKPRNEPFYLRHGFEPMAPLKLPDGCPPLQPMWRSPVGARYSVVAGQAAFRYSLMSPLQRVELMTACCSPGGPAGRALSGGRWPRERWGRCSL